MFVKPKPTKPKMVLGFRPFFFNNRNSTIVDNNKYTLFVIMYFMLHIVIVELGTTVHPNIFLLSSSSFTPFMIEVCDTGCEVLCGVGSSDSIGVFRCLECSLDDSYLSPPCVS
jgi:hypothetical protein